jgi:purine-binding chemotaxis protein CheW
MWTAGETKRGVETAARAALAARLVGAQPALSLLSFRLGEDLYAVELARVREIVPFQGAVWLPGYAAAVRGAVPLRGEAVPAVELAAALGLPASEVTPESCLLIVEAGRAAARAPVGLIADAVREIVAVDAAAVAAPPPQLGALAEHLSGVVAHGGGWLRLIHCDRLLGANPRVRGAADLAAERPPGGPGTDGQSPAHEGNGR